MKISKNAIQGIGALSVTLIIAGAGFFVVAPQLELASDHSKEAKKVEQTIQQRNLRLDKLTSEASNLGKLSEEVQTLLASIPQDKEIAGIVRSIVASLDVGGVKLDSFSHGAIDPAQPGYKAPEVNLAGNEPIFEIDQKKGDPEETPELAGVPVIITVTAATYPELFSFTDALQNAERFMSVQSVEASGTVGEITATIYIYAFTGSSSNIDAWVKAQAG